MHRFVKTAHMGFAAFAVSAHLASAALYTDASQLPVLSYDFVVVGGASQMVSAGEHVLTLVYSWSGGECNRLETHRKPQVFCSRYRSGHFVIIQHAFCYY